MLARAGEDAASRLREALTRFDEVRIQTLHGFCAQVLRESAFELGEAFDGDPGEAGRALRLSALQDAWRALTAATPPWLEGWLHLKHYSPDTLESSFKIVLHHPEARFRPDPADFEAWIARVETAMAGVRSAWDPTPILAALDSVSRWKVAFERQGYPEALLERVRGDGAAMDPDLWSELGPEGLAARIHRMPRTKEPWLSFFASPLGRALTELEEAREPTDRILDVSTTTISSPRCIGDWSIPSPDRR